jgi:hypothetical protein
VLRLIKNDRVILALLWLAMTLAALPVLTYPMGRDQGMYANIARAILNGGLPYIDAWDIKPPAIYYIYALGIALFGSGSAALRAIDLVTVPFTLIGLYWLGRHLANRRVAILAVVLFTVFYFTETFASLTQSDSVVTLPMTLAVVCTVQAGDSPRASRRALLWSFVAGALCAATLWFKHYYALFVLAVVVHHLWVRRGLPVKETLAFALGGLPVGALPLLYFASVGVVQEMIYVAQGTARYNAQGLGSLQAFVDQMDNYVWFRWQHWGALLVLAGLWPVLRVYSSQFTVHSLEEKDNAKTQRRKGFYSLLIPHHSLLLLWLLAGLGFVVLQAKGFDTHWIPLLPPLCLLAAESTSALIDGVVKKLSVYSSQFSVDSVEPSANSEQPSANNSLLSSQSSILSTQHFKRSDVLSTSLYLLAILAFLVILFRAVWLPALPYLAGRETQMDYYQKFQGNDLKPAESLQMVDFLRQHVAPGDTLFIWGFRPEVYYLANLKPASRFIAHFPLVGDYYPAEWKQEAVASLWAALPPYVLVLQSDYMPWVTGSHDDSHTLLVQYTGLSDWLAYSYVRDTEIGNFLIWRRKP